MKITFTILLILALLTPAITGCADIPDNAIQLKVYPVKTKPQRVTDAERPGQLPHSRIAFGSRDIKAAWFAIPTRRHRHGVLGDSLEAASLVVETRDNQQLQFDLPVTRVFEDLEPRLADLNHDGLDEIIVVESDVAHGAALAVYHVAGDKLVRLAMTQFLGQNRWLNPLGVGDFDGDGKTEIALVATPHISGKLRLYKLNGSRLDMFAEYPGVSTHRIGSTELGLGRVVPGKQRHRVLIPDQSRQTLFLLEWSQTGWRELARAVLTSAINSSLVEAENGKWLFIAEDGKRYEVSLRQ